MPNMNLMIYLKKRQWQSSKVYMGIGAEKDKVFMKVKGFGNNKDIKNNIFALLFSRVTCNNRRYRTQRKKNVEGIFCTLLRCKPANDYAVKFTTGENRVRDIHRTLHSEILKNWLWRKVKSMKNMYLH